MLKVLYIEDNALNRDFIERRLRRMGIVALTAEDGFSGIRKAVEQRPDLIFLDLNLPDIDGLEVLQRLRKIEATASLKIIAVTANAMHGDKAFYLANGFDDYLPKPILRYELTRILITYLPKHFEDAV